MSGTVRINIAVGDQRLELEGSEEWVAAHGPDIELMLQRLRERHPDARPQERGMVVLSQPQTPNSASSLPDEPVDFGELLLTMPRGVSATDQVLLAGWFAQQKNPENTFVTRDANQLLVEQGVKVGNPSQCMANNLKAKRVFKVGGAFRVAKPGVEYLTELQMTASKVSGSR